MAARPYQGSGSPAQPPATLFSYLPRVSIMDTNSRRSQRRDDGTLSSLNAAIEAMNLAKEISSMTPAKAVFGSVSILLTMIRVGSLLISYDPFWAHI